MDYYTIQGSNSVTTGQPLNLDITVSAANFPSTKSPSIKLSDEFTIENLDVIVSKADWDKLVVKLYGKTNDPGTSTTPVCLSTPDIPDMPGPISCLLNSNLPAYISFEIRISNKAGTWKDETLKSFDLNIKFYDDNNPNNVGQDDPQALQFTVRNVKSQPEITSFEADPTVLLCDSRTPLTKETLNLSWKVNTADYTYTLSDGQKVIASDKMGPPPRVNNSFSIDDVGEGNHTYTLAVTQGGLTVKQSVSVRALRNPGPNRVPDDALGLQVGNICVANDSSALFSILLNGNEIECLGYSNEGFSGNWSKIQLNINDKNALKPYLFSPMAHIDKNALKPYLFSPMVHIRQHNQALGKLFIIGGSRVDATICSKSILTIDLEKDSIKEDIVKVIDCTWPSRMGHSCVIFPHGNVEKIWVMGGQDRFGTCAE